MRKTLAKLSKQGLIYGFGNVFPKFLGFLLIPLYTRFLSPSDYGIISLLSIVTVFVGSILKLSQDASVLRFYYDFKDNEKSLKNYLGTVFTFVLLFGFVVVLVLSFFGEPIFSSILKKIPFNPYIILTLWTIFFTLLSSMILMLFRVKEEVLKFSLFKVFNFLLSTLLIIYFVVFLKQEALGFVKGTFCAALVFFIVYLFIFLKNAGPFNFTHKDLKRSLIYGIPLIPGAMAMWVIQMSDHYFLNLYQDLQSVGIYSIGYNFASAIAIISFTINQTVTPYFLSIANSQHKVQEIIPLIFTYFILIVAFFVVVLSVFSQEIILIMTEKRYHDAYIVIPIISFAYLFQVFYQVASCGLIHKKKSIWLVSTVIIAAISNIVLNVLMIPVYGMIGAAYATLISYFIYAALTYGISQKYYRLRYEWKRIFMIIIISLAIIVIGYNVSFGLIYSILIKIGLVLTFPLSLYLIGFFTHKEIQRLRELVQKFTEGSFIGKHDSHSH